MNFALKFKLHIILRVSKRNSKPLIVVTRYGPITKKTNVSFPSLANSFSGGLSKGILYSEIFIIPFGNQIAMNTMKTENVKL